MSISKIFIQNFVCVLTNKLNRIFILLPRSCPGVGLQGAGGVKNFRVGICDGAPSTARSSFFVFFCPENVVFLLCLLHIFKCTSEYVTPNVHIV